MRACAVKYWITRRAMDGDSGGSPWLMRCSCSARLLARLFLEQVAKRPGLQRWEQVIVVIVNGHDHRLHVGLLFAQACTTSTPEPSGRPRSSMATSKRMALTSSSAS
jgi:hypothetical protein